MIDDPARLGLQISLLAVSGWVLGAIVLGASLRTVGLGGIAVLLVTMVGVRAFGEQVAERVEEWFPEGD